MGLTRRICGPRRVPICWPFAEDAEKRALCDPALADDMDIKGYVESLFDPAFLKVKEGAQPTFFTIRPLPRRLGLLGEGTARIRSDWVLRCCVRAVDGLTVFDEESKEQKPVTLKMVKAPVEGEEILSEESMDLLAFSDMERLALSKQVEAITEAGKGPLLRSCVMPSGPGESSKKDAGGE